jgi:hypothetical protein
MERVEMTMNGKIQWGVEEGIGDTALYAELSAIRSRLCFLAKGTPNCYREVSTMFDEIVKQIFSSRFTKHRREELRKKEALNERATEIFSTLGGAGALSKALHDELMEAVPEGTKTEPWAPMIHASELSYFNDMFAFESELTKALPDVPVMTEGELQIKNGFRPQLDEDMNGDDKTGRYSRSVEF